MSIEARKCRYIVSYSLAYNPEEVQYLRTTDRAFAVAFKLGRDKAMERCGLSGTASITEEVVE